MHTYICIYIYIYILCYIYIYIYIYIQDPLGGAGTLFGRPRSFTAAPRQLRDTVRKRRSTIPASNPRARTNKRPDVARCVHKLLTNRCSACHITCHLVCCVFVCIMLLINKLNVFKYHVLCLNYIYIYIYIMFLNIMIMLNECHEYRSSALRNSSSSPKPMESESCLCGLLACGLAVRPIRAVRIHIILVSLLVSLLLLSYN